MLYPVYVHQYQDSAYGAVVPDLPGVHSAADEVEALAGMIQEAVALRFEGETTAPPLPSPASAYLAQPQYQGGFWMLVDIDLSTLG